MDASMSLISLLSPRLCVSKKASPYLHALVARDGLSTASANIYVPTTEVALSNYYAIFHVSHPLRFAARRSAGPSKSFMTASTARAAWLAEVSC